MAVASCSLYASRKGDRFIEFVDRDALVSINKPFCSPLVLIVQIAGLKQAKNVAGKYPHLIQTPFGDAEFGKNLVYVSRQLAATTSRRFEF